MTWYAVSAVLVFRFKEGDQNIWPIWESVYLVSANSPEEAEAKATVLAKQNEGDDDGSLTCGDRPATREFMGIRKILTVQSPHSSTDEPVDGAELTFSDMEVQSESDLQALVAGKPVFVNYIE
ncbi:MAG TPA: DUF4288 domain-containing protein [Steroidobacteraceae bacterium]|nr:DUF4288 domain-containing protein [Steroidobacteraceae bacterium]